MSKVAILYPDPVMIALRTFPGAKVAEVDKPLFCIHCDRICPEDITRLLISELTVLLEKRRGKIIDRVWPDGRHEWACHSCGRVTAEQSA